MFRSCLVLDVSVLSTAHPGEIALVLSNGAGFCLFVSVLLGMGPFQRAGTLPHSNACCRASRARLSGAMRTKEEGCARLGCMPHDHPHSHPVMSCGLERATSSSCRTTEMGLDVDSSHLQVREIVEWIRDETCDTHFFWFISFFFIFFFY